MAKKYIIANWKMSPATWGEAQGILEASNEALEGIGESKELSLVFCPPFVFIPEAQKILETSHLMHEAQLGAQDIAVEDTGAFTGEVSGPMLVHLGVQYVIVGHSERRWKLGESDEIVNTKLKAVLRNGMTPIVCLGERKREGGWEGELTSQTDRTFAGLSPEEISQCLIAYEPVWAISTTPGAKPDTPSSALQSLEIIKKAFHFPSLTFNFLYGGSITPANAKDFLSVPEFFGVLVGGASVRKEDFAKILQIASALTPNP